MPTYDYKCEKCPRSFSAMKKISERAEAECPVCKTHAKQSVTAPRGINGGFYDTVTRVS